MMYCEGPVVGYCRFCGIIRCESIRGVMYATKMYHNLGGTILTPNHREIRGLQHRTYIGTQPAKWIFLADIEETASVV